MTAISPERRQASPSAPSRSVERWVPELLEVLDERRVQVMRLALGFVVTAALLSKFRPSLLSPSVPVGLLVGVAATMLAAAAAFGLDAMDPVVGGPRHVRGTGASVLSHGRDSHATAADLAAHLDRSILGTSTVRIALVAPPSTSALAAIVGREMADALAAMDHRVILADLQGPSDTPGVADVVFGRVPLAQAVTFEAGVTMASIGAGPDLAEAVRTHPTFLRNLPADIDVALALMASTTADAHEGVVEGIDHVFVVIEREVTRRPDLVQVLDGLEATGVQTHVVLVESARRTRSSAQVAPLVTTRAQADALAAQLSPMMALGLDERSQPEPSLIEPSPVMPSPVIPTPPVVQAPVEPLPVVQAPVESAPARPTPIEPPVVQDPGPELSGEENGLGDDDLDPELIAQALLSGDVDYDVEPLPTTGPGTPARGDVARSPITGGALGEGFVQRRPGGTPGADLPTNQAHTEVMDRAGAVAPTSPTIPTAAAEVPDASLTSPMPRVVLDPAPRADAAPTAPIIELDAAPAVAAEEQARPLGAAVEGDDPLGMTAALHSFAAERLGRDGDGTS